MPVPDSINQNDIVVGWQVGDVFQKATNGEAGRRAGPLPQYAIFIGEEKRTTPDTLSSQSRFAFRAVSLSERVQPGEVLSLDEEEAKACYPQRPYHCPPKVKQPSLISRLIKRLQPGKKGGF